jgi:phenylacetate-CoA ligase
MLESLAWSAYLAFHLVGQKAAPFLPLRQITKRQRKRLRRMVRYARRHVPYYRETMDRLGISPEDIRSVEDLSRLPIIENDHLRRDPEYYASRVVDRSGRLGLPSSGSSGAPKTVWHDPAALLQNAAHGERERAIMIKVLGRWSGYREMVIVAAVGASQREIQEFVRDHTCFPKRLRIERQYVFLSDPREKNLPLINDFGPDLLYAYGSYLDMLFNYIRSTGAAWHRPKACT